MTGNAIVREPGEGTAYWVLGGLYEVKVAGGETGGASLQPPGAIETFGVEH